MTGTKKLLLGVGALVLSALLAAWLMAAQDEGPRLVVAPASATPVAVNASQLGTHGESPTPKADSDPAGSDANRPRATSDPDQKLTLANASSPYPLLAALHARGGPGDYALVRWFVNECAMAGQLAHYAVKDGLLTGNTAVPVIPLSAGKRATKQPEVTSQVHAQRVAAAQEIQRRCSGELSAFIEPHPGDKYARLLSSWNEVQRVEVKPAELLDAHAAQGAPVTSYVLQLEILKRHAAEFSAFKSESEIEGLLNLAAYAAQSDPASPGASLRALGACVSFGWCGKRPEELDLTFFDLPPGSPQHAKALELVPRVRALLRL